MPRKQRTPKHRHDLVLSLDELRRRSRFGGVLSGVPALTPDERVAYEGLRRAEPTWRPQRALWQAWSSVDDMHGNLPWSLSAFQTALDADRIEIASVVVEHPEHRDHLRRWVQHLEALGLERNADQAPMPGRYYSKLAALGYDGTDDPGKSGRKKTTGFNCLEDDDFNTSPITTH